MDAYEIEQINASIEDARLDFALCSIRHEVHKAQLLRSMAIFEQLISSFAATINYGARADFDWDAFIDYCNTPCYRYKA